MMLRKYSKIILIVALVINIYLAGLHRGFQKQFYQFSLSEPIIAGGDYLFIIFFLLILLAGKFVKNKLVSNLICLSSLALIINRYKYIYWYATGLSDEKEPFVLLFQESTPLDLISFSIIMLLLIHQIVIAFQDSFSKNRTTLNTL